MFLKSLEMQGFKSFPDKTKLMFRPGITAVVGPNGSGKSNVSDAVRWVLGEQSTKSLRGSKMEDVIFGGTNARRPQGVAEVTLTLDNYDRALASDEDEVRITRRYYRSGESEYMLNRATVRLKDIHELFMDTGLGRDGYSIVGQGRIADIISSKGEERREIFEEAAGISRYRYRRNDAQRKLSQAQENLIRLKDILAELEGRIEPLKEQSEKAEKFVVLAQEQKQLQIGLWMNAIEKAKEDLRRQENLLFAATQQYNETQSRLKETEKESESIHTEIQNKSAALDDFRRKTLSADEEILRLQGQVQVLESTISHNADTVSRIVKDKEQAEDTHRHISQSIAEKKEALSALRLEAEQNARELSEKEARLTQVQAKASAVKHSLDSLILRKNELQLKSADVRVEMSTALSSMEEIENRAQKLDGMLEARRSELVTSKKRREECEENLKFCEIRVKEEETALLNTQESIKSTSRACDEKKRENEKTSLEMQQKLQRAKVLRDMEKNLEGYNFSVKAVMQQARQGRLEGICGPVSQLINVPGRFAVAIETALGGALQNIVTETQNHAKTAIEYLKNQRAGRATFLPISAVNGTELNEPGLKKCEGVIDIASHVVQAQPQYAGVIKSLLGRTVVVENIDFAIEIAKRFAYKFRIVTLDGQLVNAGGSMTGGSQVKNAGMLSRASEIENMSGQAVQLQAKLKAGEEEYKKLLEDLAGAKRQEEERAKSLAAAREEKMREGGELKLLCGQEQSAGRELEELENEKQNAVQRLQRFEEGKEKAQNALEAITQEINAAEESRQAQTLEHQELLKEQAELADAAARLKISCVSQNKDIEALQEALDSLERRKLSHSGKVDEIETEIEAIRENSSVLEKRIDGLKLEIEKNSAEKAQWQEKAAQAQSERQELEERGNKIRTLERDLAVEREKYSAEMERTGEKQLARQKEYDDIISKLYDEYQLTKSEAEALEIRLESVTKAQRDLAGIKSKIKQLGVVNLAAIEEYKEVSQRYEFLSAQIQDVEKSRIELRKMIEELTFKMREQFKTQFEKINERFGETFVELFGGGKAVLSFENPADILESDIAIRVQPPGKNVQNIDLFSGGEKALVAIALLFAILKVTPSPFCIFDEVEAALDDVNVERFAQYMRQMTDKTQFVAITHRRGTMEEADVLYGVTMQEEGVSKLLQLNAAEIAQKLGIQ